MRIVPTAHDLSVGAGRRNAGKEEGLECRMRRR